MEEIYSGLSAQRRLTRHRIFQYIYDSKTPVTKPQLAEALDLSMPTVYQNIGVLLEEGLIRVGKVLKSTGGRPPVAYEVNKDKKFAVGAAISAAHLRLLVSNLNQEEICYRRIPIVDREEMESVGLRLLEEIRKIIGEYELKEEDLLGIGITIPGVIDKEKDLVTLSPTLNLKELELDKIRKHLPYKVFFENDSTCAGLAEWLTKSTEEAGDGEEHLTGGEMEGREDFVYMLLEYGVGGALFLNGQPYYGKNHRSAEFGHTIVEENGLSCSCGKDGCLEAYISASRFSRNLGIHLNDFFAGVEAGREDYCALWEDGLNHLATGINNLRMIFDCDVYLGGLLTEYMEPYMEDLKSRVAKKNPFGDTGDFVKFGHYARRAGLRGITWQILEEYISQV